MLFSIHNIVGIRFIGESDAIRSHFEKEWKIFRTQEDIHVDIEVEFVEKIPLENGTEFISIFTAYTPEGDFIYFDRYGSRALLPFEKFDKNWIKIIAERSIHPPSLYNYVIMPALRVCLLKRGYAFLHASSVVVDEKGIIFPAWAGTGKSSLAIRFLKDEAVFMSDELSIVSKDGILYSYPNTLNLYDYNFKEFPELYKFLNRKTKMQFVIKTLFEKFVFKPGQRLPVTSTLRNILLKLEQLSKNLVRVKISAEDIFDVITGDKAPIEKIFFIIRGKVKEPLVKNVSPAFLAKKMSSCLEFEFNYYYIYYLMFKFAFPGKESVFIENVVDEQRKILESAFDGKDIYYCVLPSGENTECFYKMLREKYINA